MSYDQQHPNNFLSSIADSLEKICEGVDRDSEDPGSIVGHLTKLVDAAVRIANALERAHPLPAVDGVVCTQEEAVVLARDRTAYDKVRIMRSEKAKTR